MMRLLEVIFTCIVIFAKYGITEERDNDIFSSITELEKLFGREKEFIQELEELADYFDKTSRKIRHYLRKDN